MAMGLMEYAALHPQAQPDQQEQAEMQDAARAIRAQAENRQRADMLKESILRRLEAGDAPHAILYAACDALGLLSDDPEWTEAARSQLDRVYGDLAQQGMFIDEAAVSAARLETMHREYTDRLRKQLQRQLSACQRIEKALQDALNTTPAPAAE